MREEKSNVQCLMRPASVAIIGASERPGSLGLGCMLNLSRVGYRGRVYPINPKYEELQGLRCYPSLAALPEQVDCALVCVPARAVPGVIAEAGAAGARAGVVYGSGFAETGEAGQQLQAELREAARAHGMAICGPNCLGIVNLRDRFTGFSAALNVGLDLGRVGALCQSGSLAIALLNSGRGLKYSYVISSGNEAVVTAENYLEFLVEDDGTDVIIAFVEGFRNTAKLRQVARRAAELDKPVIMLKVGRSQVGQWSAAAHTGALAGSDAVFDAFARQAGIIRVNDLDELLETATLFLSAPRPKGNRVGAIAISGGEVALLSDVLEDTGLEIATLSEETVQGLKAALPPFCNVNNPLDAWGVGDLGQTYATCLETLGRDPSVDLVAVSQDAQAGLGEDQAKFYRQLACSVASVHERLSKPLVFFCNMSGAVHPLLREVLDEAGVSTLHGMLPSLRAIRHLMDFATFRREGRRAPILPGQTGRHLAEVAGMLGEHTLSEHASKQVLAAYGIPCTREALASSLAEAKAAAAEIGYPVVLKVDSPDIIHKTEAGAVRLRIADEGMLTSAYEEVLANVKKANPAARINGVLVQEMVDMAQAVEVIAGIAHDPQFGPTVLFGLGGILVEALHDVTLRVAPLSEQDAWSMLEEIRSAAILKGVRGKPPADRAAIVSVLLKLSELTVDLNERIAAVDINPLIVLPEGRGAVAADALIVT